MSVLCQPLHQIFDSRWAEHVVVNFVNRIYQTCTLFSNYVHYAYLWQTASLQPLPSLFSRPVTMNSWQCVTHSHTVPTVYWLKVAEQDFAFSRIKGNNRVKTSSSSHLSRVVSLRICPDPFQRYGVLPEEMSTLNFPSSVSLCGISSSDCLLCREKQPHFSMTTRDRGQWLRHY